MTAVSTKAAAQIHFFEDELSRLDAR